MRWTPKKPETRSFDSVGGDADPSRNLARNWLGEIHLRNLFPRRMVPTLFSWLAMLAVCLFAFVSWRPFAGGEFVDLSQIRIDKAYMIALPELYLSHAQYGPDVVFTYGPLGWLCWGWYPSMLFGYAMLARISLALVFAVGMHKLATPSKLRWKWLVLVPLYVLGSMFSEGFAEFFWVSFSLLAGLLYLDEDRPSRITVALTGAAALVGLIKFTFLIMALAVFVITAIYDVKRKRIPRISSLFFVCLAAFWLMAGQAFWNLPIWIARCLDLSSGYGEAMAKGFYAPYRGIDVIIFAVGAILPVAALLWDRRTKSDVLVVGGWMVAANFLQYKHAWGGNQIESAAITLLFLVLLTICLIQRWTPVAIVAVLIGSVAPAMLLARYDALPLYELLRPKVALARLVDLGDVMTGHIGPYRDAYEHMLASVRRVAKLPRLSGTIDAMTDNAGVAAAYASDPTNGSVYHPRPAYLGINAHTASAATKNAEFLLGPSAPSWMLFEVTPEGERVDNRYPASVDGRAWLSLLIGYHLVDQANGLLILEKQSPVPYTLRSLGVRKLSWGQSLEIPMGKIWAEIIVKQSLVGLVFDVLYKVPHVNLHVNSQGMSRSFQILPRVAKVGFLLSPFIDSTEDFKMFVTGRNPPPIQSLSLNIEDDLRAFYTGEVEVRLYQLEMPSFSELKAPILTGAMTFRTLSCAFPPETQWDATAAKSVLVAHAPCDINVPVPAGAQKVKLSFGLRDDSSGSDGAEFQVWQDGKTVFSRTILWGNAEATVELAVSPGNLDLVTLPAASGNNAHDHTYWAGVVFK